ncbi:ribonuclease HIII [[Mycoplasma] anseris]|nr:ribonuclease HIII [[Mycoplasma] anseris]
MELFKDFIGIDETGVGDYFSPIVSVACFIPKENYQKVIELNVKDSKKLSDKKICEIAPLLINLVHFQKTVLTQGGYNKLIQSKINNNEIKTLLHINSLNNFLKKHDLNNSVIIDQYTSSRNIFDHHLFKLNNIDWIKLKIPKVQIVLETKAEDKALSVACASIIARYYLLKLMEKQNLEWNLVFPLGASKIVDEVASEIILHYGIDTLNQIAKISFKTTNKAIEIAEQKKLKTD